MTEPESIGRRIQEAREEAGLSQEELASRLGITQSALSNYELGKRRLHLSNLQKIAGALNRPLNCFLGLEELEDETPTGAPETPPDRTLREITRLAGDMPPDEREFLLDYMRWRLGWLKARRDRDEERRRTREG